MIQQWKQIIEVLSKKCGVQFARGLSSIERAQIESRYSFRFPEDLAEFLSVGLPISERFPDWRNGNPDDLRSWLDLPYAGIMFDVQHNGFWLDEWGKRPDDLDSVKKVVRKLIKAAPTLIPIYAHRMIPDRPDIAGNPVFSVHQADIIYYGCNLQDYFVNEFFNRSENDFEPIHVDTIRAIEFWDLDRFATRWDNGPNIFDGSSDTTR